MKPTLPAPIAALIVTAIGGLTNAAGEIHMAHPLHQALVTVAALAAGIIGYLALPSSTNTSVPGLNAMPPYDIPAVISPQPAQPGSRAQIDELAQRQSTGELGLP